MTCPIRSTCRVPRRFGRCLARWWYLRDATSIRLCKATALARRYGARKHVRQMTRQTGQVLDRVVRVGLAHSVYKHELLRTRGEYTSQSMHDNSSSVRAWLSMDGQQGRPAISLRLPLDLETSRRGGHESAHRRPSIPCASTLQTCGLMDGAYDQSLGPTSTTGALLTIARSRPAAGM